MIALSHNNITNFAENLFLVFLDTRLFYMLERKALIVEENPLICNDEFYMLKNMTMISFGYSVDQWKWMNCDNRSNNNEIMNNRDAKSQKKKLNPQKLHIKSLHLKQPIVEMYSHANFQLKIHASNAELMIVQEKKSRFRLLIRIHNEPNSKKNNEMSWLSQMSASLEFNGTDPCREIAIAIGADHIRYHLRVILSDCLALAILQPYDTL